MQNTNKYFKMLAVLLIALLSLVACTSEKVELEIADESIDNNSKFDNENNSGFADVLEKDKKIPSYNFSYMDGSSANIDDYKGNVVIVTFFTTWCGYCQKELPVLEKLSNEIDDLTVIGIDSLESSDEVSEFVKQMEVTFPIYCDEDGTMKKTFYVNGFPTFAMINPEGIFMGTISGYNEEEDLLKYINFARNEYEPTEDKSN